MAPIDRLPSLEYIKPTVEHLDDDFTSQDSLLSSDNNLNGDAQEAADYEHSLTVKEALVFYRKAILWAIVISASIIMEGYDLSLMVSFFGYPEFQKKYGVPLGDGNYELKSKWMAAIGSGSNIGMMIGASVNGYLIDKWGHRRVIMCGLIAMSLFVGVTFFAPTVEVLFIGQFLCGLPWGVFAIMGPLYSSEITPVCLRGYLTAYTNMCWAMGQLIAAGVLRAMVKNKTQWGYRIPFAVQWVWPIPLFIMTYFAPESPWWLMKKGRETEALESIKRLTSPAIHYRASQTVAMISHTNSKASRQSINTKDKGFWQNYAPCFEGTNLRRTEIACITFSIQVLCGAALMYSPLYFFRQVGFSADDTYKLNLGITGIALTGCICSWFLLSRYGRRTIFLTGFSILCLCLLMVAFLQSKADSISNAAVGQCIFIMVWVLTFSLSIGPVTYTIVSEIPSSVARSQTVALARSFYHLCQLLSNGAEPYLINPQNANLKGYTALVWASISIPALIWAYFRLPETKDRLYSELDLLFQRKVPARKFVSYRLECNLHADSETS